jgi:ankyrin repeat protein
MNIAARKTNPFPDAGGREKRITPNIVKAAKENNTAGVKSALRSNPACVNDVDSQTLMSALHWSCANRNSEIYDILVAQDGIDLRPTNSRGQEPAELAMRSGASKIADDLHRRIHFQDHMSADPYGGDSTVTIFDPDPS